MQLIVLGRLQHGGVIPYDHPDILGHWQDPASTATWTAELADGDYTVALEYACEPGNEGGAFELTIGDQVLSATIEKATANWQTYREVEIGNVEIEDGGETPVTLKATSIPDGKALMNLRRVMLRP